MQFAPRFRPRLLVALASSLAVSACHPSVGRGCSEAEMNSARTIAYDSTGAPAYVGQAILIRSCAGGGSFCHAEGASDRYGAPASLNLDPILADDPRYPDEATGAAHLYDAQLRAHREREDIYGTVWNGSMPPGQAGLDTQSGAYRIYASASDTTGAEVPGLDTNEGLEMLRVWLACGSPVIEATSPLPSRPCTTNDDCAPVHECDFGTGQCVPVGAVVARRAGTGTAHWSSIYSSILEPACATPACHGAAGAAFSGDLDLSSAATAYAAMVAVAAHASGCGTRIAAGNPDGSFLVAKLEGTQNPTMCGEAMPVGSMLPADQIALVRAWIAAGALAD